MKPVAALFAVVLFLVAFQVADTRAQAADGAILHRLNAGGAAVPSIDGGPDWLPDSGFVTGDSQVITDREVLGIDDQSVPPSTPGAVFETERFNPPDTSPMGYRMPVAAGTQVEVRLFMMNGFSGTSQPGQRVFDVEIEGARLDGIDPSRMFGHRIGGMVSAVVTSDGQVDIAFHRRVQAPLVNAIEIIAVGGGPPPPVSGVLYRLNAGGPIIAPLDSGPAWVPDDGFHSGGSQVVTGRTVSALHASVPSSTPGAVFETERFNPPGTTDLRYDFAVDAGRQVEVRLFMMNGFSGTSQPGQRVFDVEINGGLVFDNVDLSRDFGHQVGAMLSAGATSDGSIRIVFKRDVQAPLVNAIEIIAAGGGPPPEVVVPNVVGLPQANAEAAITGAGLVVGEVTFVEDDALPAGQVVSQDPPAGTQVAAETAVNLAVAIRGGGNPPPGQPVRPQAVPASGPAPLTVRFLPEFDTATAIELFEWDFDGDGTIDESETIGVPQTFTYETAGVYTATLRLTDSNGEQTVGTVVVDVTNTSPQVTAEAAPSNGQVPLNVTLTATATDNEGIATYEWDFEGDGVFDFSSTTTGQTTFTYTAPGTFQAVVRVTDTLGASTTLAVPVTEVRPAPAGALSAAATAAPGTGQAPLAVNFNATGTDPTGGALTGWAWDFNGDGTFDHTGSTPQTSFTYTAAGTYYARVRVTAGDGRTAEDAVQVIVEPSATLAMSTDTIDPDVGETVGVQTVLGGETRVSVVMEDRHGTLIRTLVPFTDRAAGTYEDRWDGRDANGNLVAEGDYYAVLLLDVAGQIRRLDLRETAGDAQSVPERSDIPPRFSPFANDPLVVTFTLAQASGVSAFIGREAVNTRLVTFFKNRPFGRGSHTIVWNGDASDGQLIHPPPRDSFIFGMVATTLPANAVFVNTLAQVSGLSATPSIFVPSEETSSTLRFDLTKPADVELVISDATTGGEVARFRHPGRAAGANVLTWDGRDADGTYVAPGRYRLGITAVDANGSRSITLYTLQRVFF